MIRRNEGNSLLCTNQISATTFVPVCIAATSTLLIACGPLVLRHLCGACWLCEVVTVPRYMFWSRMWFLTWLIGRTGRYSGWAWIFMKLRRNGSRISHTYLYIRAVKVKALKHFIRNTLSIRKKSKCCKVLYREAWFCLLDLRLITSQHKTQGN